MGWSCNEFIWQLSLTKCMVSTVYQLQHPTSTEGEERLSEGLLEAHEQLSVQEDDGEHQEA